MSKIIKNIIKLIIQEVEVIKILDFPSDSDINSVNSIFLEHNNFRKSFVILGSNTKYKLPVKDIFSLIHNESDKVINFKLFLGEDELCDYIIHPNESLFPLYNNNIIPLFLLKKPIYISSDQNLLIPLLRLSFVNLSNLEKSKFLDKKLIFSINNNNKIDVIKNGEYYFDKSKKSKYISLSIDDYKEINITI